MTSPRVPGSSDPEVFPRALGGDGRGRAPVAPALPPAQPAVAAPIASARTVGQLPAQVGAAGLEPTRAETERLPQASA
ncbi:hypothetical protein ACIBBD_06380 [Streptomyces sp. NPDC051315]|uniref:hypothetical protein n=1 Tax=Streptomyces sp. NPDC051315 TaxID=3365650 RepID=UPI0037B6877D